MHDDRTPFPPHLYEGFAEEIVEESRTCGCNEPWLHASDTLHKASYDMSCAIRMLAREMFAALPRPIKWLFRYRK